MSIELLNGYTQRIKKYEIENTKNFAYIGMNLFEIQEMNLLENTDYKNIKQYALNEFGYESSTTYNLINVYKKFFHSNVAPKVKFNIYGDYSYTQLVNMLNMSDDELKLCDFKMSVKQIKEIRLKKSNRLDFESIENTDNLKNEIPGQNVITGIFPDKKEEEKQSTLIVSQLPKAELNSAAAATETRTIITETITSQNNNFVPNEYETYKEKYEQNCKDSLKLNIEIQELKQKIDNHKNVLLYSYNELFFICQDINNDKKINTEKLNKLLIDIHNFNTKGFLPDKVQFMQEVI